MFYTIAVMAHNYKIVKQAERMINSFLEDNDDNHKTWLYLVNPDGTKIRVQEGCKLESYEAVFNKNKSNRVEEDT